MSRYEYKYYIPLQYLDNLREAILPYLRYDIHSESLQKKEYTVRSIYLDSPRLLTYYEKLAGTKERNKFRVRGYNNLSENPNIFIEIKRKSDDQISKDRVKLLYSDLDKFIEEKDYSLLKGYPSDGSTITGARNFLYYYNLYHLKPTILITYDREAFECKFDTGLRITFDKYVRTKLVNSFSDLFSDENLMPSLRKYFVLEIKFHRIVPSWLPVVFKKYNLFRDSASKYCMSIDTTINNIYSKYIF
jgi:SPX domain protein involved in polyphosphate accumulation